MNENEQKIQESLFDEKMLNGDQKEEEQVQETSQEPSLSQESPVSDLKPESEPPREAPKPKERAGTILKKKREAQGISLEIIHEATKIPMDALRAIEEGYTVRTLSSFYYQGFVKMYAEYLRVDISTVIEDYKEEKLPEHITRDIDDGGFQMPSWITGFFTRQRKRQIIITLGILLALFLFVKIIGFVGKLFSRPSVKKNAGQTQIVKKETVTPSATKTESRKKAGEPKKRPEPIPAVKATASKRVKEVQPKVAPLVTSKPVSEPASKPVAVAPTTASVSVALLSKAITLTVRAKQNSWLRVKADGNVVFQSTLRLGAVETWAADDEIEISGKNIDQLEFELNGKMIGTLGRKDRNAKKVLITKNGLSVKN